ncbi:unnamed protein product, partial [Pocillopora meandrina]
CSPTAQRSETSVATNSSSLQVQAALFELWEAFNKKEKSLRQLLKGYANTNRPMMH